ncbi:MoxR-like ATPase [Paenibacillus harenae]|nr:MoxR-like ATPase [Paenibacillus harenae]
MANILLADEINRATTKTQSALLEAMEEGHVTVDGDTYELPQPFILLATQNPIEFEGTYSLPEAQLDRFMMKLSLGYPSQEDEQRMVLSAEDVHPSDRVEQLISMEDMIQIQKQAMNVHIDDAVGNYLVSLIRSTREHASVLLGASPRAAIALARAAKASAYVKQRQFVTPDDVKELAPYVLAHRVLLRTESRMNGLRPEDVISQVLQNTKVPVRLER